MSFNETKLTISKKIEWFFHELQFADPTPRDLGAWKALAQDYQADLESQEKEIPGSPIIIRYLTMVRSKETLVTDVKDPVVGEMLMLFPRQKGGWSNPTFTATQVRNLSVVADTVAAFSDKPFEVLSEREKRSFFNTMVAATSSLTSAVKKMELKKKPNPAAKRKVFATEQTTMTASPDSDERYGNKRQKVQHTKRDGDYLLPQQQPQHHQNRTAIQADAFSFYSDPLTPQVPSHYRTEGDPRIGSDFDPNQPSYIEYWSQNGSGGFLNTPPAGSISATTFNNSVDLPQTTIGIDATVTWPSLYGSSKRNQQPQFAQPQPPSTSMRTSSANQGGFFDGSGSFDDGRHSSQF
jgi:hypothetical protein